jgi:sugar phosphate isomerase/epimerase
MEAKEIRERLSISTLVFHNFRPIGEGALKELTEHGIRKIELLQSPEQYDMTDSSSMRLMKTLFDAHGIQVVAYHAYLTNFRDVDSESKRTARVDICRRQIDTMQELGGSFWSSHAGKAKAVVVKSYEDLARHVEGTRSVIGVENFKHEEMTVEKRLAFLREIDHENVGLVLDIGHIVDDSGTNTMTTPGGPSHILAICKKHLRHVHLHGFKDGCDHHPPLVKGDLIQWVELFDMLQEVSYAGAINFEPSGKPLPGIALQHTAEFPQRIVALASNDPPA